MDRVADQSTDLSPSPSAATLPRRIGGERTLVRDVMSHQIVTISEGERLSTVEDIMPLGGV